MDGKHGEMDNFIWHMSSLSQYLSASAVPAMKGVVTKSFFFPSISTKVYELLCYFQQTLFAGSICTHTQLCSCTLVSLQF